MKKRYSCNISFFFFSLVIFLMIETNYDWNKSQILHWSAVALLIVAYAFKNGGIVDLKFREYSWWFLGLLALSLFSCLYTNNIYNTIQMLKTLIVMFVTFFIIRNYMTDSQKVYEVITAYIISSMINMCYVIANIDMSVIGNVQIGDGAIEGWNGNTIGMMAASAAILCIYMIMNSKSLMGKLIYVSCVAFLVYLFVYTGSRKAIIMFIACLLAIVYINKPNKVIRNTILACGILFVTYRAILNIESVYNILGVRLEGLIAGFTGKGKADSSTLLRQLYIENGIKWIKDSPLFGYGLDSYRTLNGPATGHRTYSHNNFIEVAMNWGIFGFVYYYSAYIIIIKKFFCVLKNNMMAVTVFSLFLVNLILHYGAVTYYEIWQNLLLCIGFAIVSNENKQLEANNVKEIN